MNLRHSLCAVLTVVLLAGPGAFLSANPARPALADREKALHVLNRLAFGARPGDVDRLIEEGIPHWIDTQLQPDRIPDPTVVSELEPFPTLKMTSAELFDRFERPVREARRRRQEGKADAAKAEEMIPAEERPRRVIEELSAARVIRAVASERQLNEVLVDFWMNHFNVYAAKGLDRIFLTSFERDSVRPFVLGKFEDLLLATAKSPAMLFYLDNARSVAEPAHRPGPVARDGAYGRAFFARQAARGIDPLQMAGLGRKGVRGLNENYARELMELHTLGVDSGYTQKDVTELARILTGWSIEPERGIFLFRPRMHDVGAKTLLGRAFPAGGGIEEGEAAIRLLARQPATARHIAYELCQRIVADDPLSGLVERVARRFLATGGDLSETVRAVVTSPEFFDPKSYRAKVKSPFEYVVSAIRATGGRTDGRRPVLREIGRMGEPLYLCQPPTGYSNLSTSWVNAGAFVDRMNFALALASNRIPGIVVDVETVEETDRACDPKSVAETLATEIVGGPLSPATRGAIEARLKTEPSRSRNSRLPLIAGLILGSPEFQEK